MQWVSEQLQRINAAAAARKGVPQLPRYNPRPKGEIQHGCASYQVLIVLSADTRRFLTHAEIRGRTSSSQKAVSWALVYLSARDLIEKTPDAARNPRYCRYRITQKGLDYANSRLML